MKTWQSLATIAIVLVLFHNSNARPQQQISRERRTSDQRLAELETLFALSKMNGKLVTVPIGFGKIDPSKLGRRRRSIGLLIRQLISDISAEDKLSNEIYESSLDQQEANDDNENEPETRN